MKLENFRQLNSEDKLHALASLCRFPQDLSRRHHTGQLVLFEIGAVYVTARFDMDRKKILELTLFEAIDAGRRSIWKILQVVTEPG